MVLLIVVFLAGVLTIVSPCILPVLPFVFAVHLVLGPGSGGKPVRYRVQLDGKSPGADHGVDTDADGNGVVTDQRLYQLIRQNGHIGEHVFSIEFLDDGVQAFAFTFG